MIYKEIAIEQFVSDLRAIMYFILCLYMFFIQQFIDEADAIHYGVAMEFNSVILSLLWHDFSVIENLDLYSIVMIFCLTFINCFYQLMFIYRKSTVSKVNY
jgi:hypothetical protein